MWLVEVGLDLPSVDLNGVQLGWYMSSYGLFLTNNDEYNAH